MLLVNLSLSPGAAAASTTTRAPGCAQPREALRSGLVRLIRYQVELVSHSAELGKRTGFHFLHQLAAVNFDCGNRNPEIKGNLLAKPPTRDLNEDLTLSRAQRGKTLLEIRQRVLILPPCTIARQTKLNGVNEILIA